MALRIRSFVSYLIFAAPILYTANGIRLHIKDLSVSNYSLSELLINYEGGFIRRGLLGQIAFDSSDPVLTITLMQKTALVFVLIGFLLILAFEKSNITRFVFTIVLLFAPGGMHDMKLGGSSVSGLFEYLDRKEIWFYVALIIIYLLVRFAFNKKMVLFAGFTLISSLTILIHELFVIFPISILAVFLFGKKINFKSKDFAYLVISFLLILFTLGLAIINHGNEQISAAITQSYAEKFPSLDIDGILQPNENAILSIGWSINQSHELAKRLFIFGTAMYYLYFAVLAIFAILIYLVIKFRNRAQLIMALIFNLAILTALVLIVYVFMDVGRLISMFTLGTLISFNILSEYFDQVERQQSFRFPNAPLISPEQQKNYLALIAIGYVFFVGSVTRVEHSNPQPPLIPLKSFLGIIE